jgi:hypothetical protein
MLSLLDVKSDIKKAETRKINSAAQNACTLLTAFAFAFARLFFKVHPTVKDQIGMERPTYQWT